MLQQISRILAAAAMPDNKVRMPWENMMANGVDPAGADSIGSRRLNLVVLSALDAARSPAGAADQVKIGSPVPSATPDITWPTPRASSATKGWRCRSPGSILPRK
jgi:hypothetical protein